jgi:hypothetical protein
LKIFCFPEAFVPREKLTADVGKGASPELVETTRVRAAAKVDQGGVICFLSPWKTNLQSAKIHC